MVHPTLKDTLELVKQHHIKLDKTGDIPYFWHLLRVMLRINTENEDVLHIALLHDIIEDTSITLDDLRNLGYNERIIEGVRWCSRNEFPDFSFIEWMTEFGKKAPIEAVLVKVSDISDNLGFERMRGLMTPVTKDSSSKKVKQHQYPIQARIEKKVKKQMRLHGEMGVFDRYYKGWNAIFQNEDLLPLISQVKINDFCNLNDLLRLKDWLSQEDFSRYFTANKLNCWQITGVVNIIQDRKGQDYLALKIDDSIAHMFQNTLIQHKQLPNDYIQNQQNRDHNTFHITLVNVMQYQKLIKEGRKDELLSIVNQSFDFFNYGIGTSIDNKKEAQAWFAVLENSYLDEFRNKLNLDKQHYHITLAFKNSDVFINPKNRNSLIINNQELWSYLNFNKPKNKIKF